MKAKYIIIGVLFLSLCACGSSSQDNDGNVINPDEVNDPVGGEVSMSVAACEAQEHLVGNWKIDEVSDGEFTLKNLVFSFGHFGTFVLSATDAKTNVSAAISGLYTVSDANHLSMVYRDQLTDKLFRDEGKFSISNDTLTLSIAGEPLYQAVKQPVEEGSLEYWYSRENPYRTDGICELLRLPEQTAVHLSGCVEDDIYGTWYLVMPEKDGRIITDSITFSSSPNFTYRGSFKWNYIVKEFYGAGDTTPSLSESDNLSYSERDNYAGSGMYNLDGEGKLHLEYDSRVGRNKTQYLKDVYTIKYNKAFLILTDKSGTEFHFLRDRKNEEPVDDDLYLPLRQRQEDGVCEGEAIEGCPAQHLIGRWALPSYYAEKLTQLEPYLFNDSYPFQDDESYPFQGFDWITFYDNGTVRFYIDGDVLYEFNYEIVRCQNSCFYYPWTIRFFMDHELIDHRGDIEQIVRNHFSRVGVSEQAMSFQFRYEAPNQGRHDNVVFYKLNSGSSNNSVQCKEDYR
jgi:hypothetical protein